MAKQLYGIYSENFPNVRLRSAFFSDIENLRVWKNRNKSSFFLKSEITPDQQLAWFLAFSARDQDHMMIVEELIDGSWLPIGSLGFRFLEGSWDIYNVMRGVEMPSGSARIGDALVLLCRHLIETSQHQIGCKVLISNPAVRWYEKIGFKRLSSEDDHYIVRLHKEHIPNLHFRIETWA